MRTPSDKTISFTFGSHPAKDLSLRWTAVLTFPAGAGAETVLPISLVDGRQEPIKAATFEFAGQKLVVRDGHAELTYGDFIKGKHEVALWLYRDGMMPIPGGLTFA